MTSRFAAIDDIPAVVEMGRAFLRDSSYKTMFVENLDQIRALAARLIASDSGDVILAINTGGTVVGMIAVIVFEHFISGQRAASEVVYWVDPAERGCGVRLLKSAEQWAKAHGAVFMQMISPTPRVDTLYERLGYAPVERIFQRAL